MQKYNKLFGGDLAGEEEPGILWEQGIHRINRAYPKASTSRNLTAWSSKMMFAWILTYLTN